MQVTTRAIRNWANEGGIPDLTLAELDLRLLHALQAVYGNPFLRDRLYLKGGTALNKLYLPGANRLSVDLDFNVIGPREQVLRERTPIGEAVAAVLRQQDPGYDLTYRWRYDQVTVYARYAPLTGTAPQRLKLEISFIERLAILGRVERPLLASPFDELIVVGTFHLEELVGTKLRALLTGGKGAISTICTESRTWVSTVRPFARWCSTTASAPTRYSTTQHSSAMSGAR